MAEKITEDQLTNLALFLLGAILVMVMFLFDWSWIDKRDYAAWVQAVGSVAAIGIAIWYPLHLRKTQEREAAAAAFIGICKLLLEVCVVLTVRKQRIQEMASGGPAVPPINDRVLEDWLIRLRSVDAMLVRPTKLGMQKVVLRNTFSALTRLITREGTAEDVKSIDGLVEGFSKLQAPMSEIARNFGAKPNMY